VLYPSQGYLLEDDIKIGIDDEDLETPLEIITLPSEDNKQSNILSLQALPSATLLSGELRRRSY
jgi:hypothetical protein